VDDDAWLPGGYRSPGRRGGETLRPVDLPDLAAPRPTPGASLGRKLDAARERVSGASFQAGGELDLGNGTFTAGRRNSTAEPEWHAGDRVRHRRFGDGTVVSSRLWKGDEWVTVTFAGHGSKELIAAYAGLEHS
jgi:DNA helicase-2/ATP-dependent DNA helicase PcrA